MLEALREQFGEAIEAAEEAGRELRVRLLPGSLLAACQFCKEKGFSYPADITAVDTGSELRVVYRFVSVATNKHLVISVGVPRSRARLPSICGAYRGAEWPEREIYDLFGVRFDGHPDLRRILLTDDWEGHPLLKQGR
jgi:NADH-quinone oxidoreductase subunit C